MADCVSLPNAAELVNFLRCDAKELSMLVNGKTECNVLWKAADAIEQLLAENAKLKEAFDECYAANEDLFAKLETMKEERDAAVADLEVYEREQWTDRGCFAVVCDEENCDECVCGNCWEWCGVQKEEKDVSKT